MAVIRVIFKVGSLFLCLVIFRVMLAFQDLLELQVTKALQDHG